MSTPTNIEAIEAEIRATTIAILGAEGWAPGYANQPEYFQKLLALEADMERVFRNYLFNLSKRIASYVAWSQYHQDIKTVQASEGLAKLDAYDVDVLFDGDGFTEDEQAQIQSLIREIYVNGVALGFAAELAKRTGTPATVGRVVESPAYQALQAAADKHIAQLSEWLDKTTAKNVVRSIQKSIALGESQELAVDRLMRYIDDPKRADMIARTESVRAYSIGRNEFALRNGATQKYWQALPGADAGSGQTPCLDNDGQTVDILDAFASGDEMTPAHPNCRCRVDYIYPDGSVVMDV